MSRDECIEKLEQFILDEDRIITYKILSRELKIHANAAKQYLSDFWDIQKSKNTPLLVSYFLAGFTEIDGIRSMKMLVVTHRHLEKEKKNFSEVTSCHIYSLSKCNVDECALLVAERFCSDNFAENCKYSAIKHISVETKPVVLKKINVSQGDTNATLPKKSESAPVKNGGSSFFQNKQTEKRKIGCENVTKEDVPEEKSEVKKDNSEKPKPKADTKSQKPNTLASMWQKKDDKSKSDKTENSKSETKGKTKSPSKNTKKPPANNILSMFSKQAVKNAENLSKKPIVTSPPPEKKTEIASPKKDSEDPLHISPSKNGMKNKKPPKATSSKRKSTSRQTKKSSKKSDDESDDEIQPKKKKRRRICTFEDSDSESDNEEAQDRAQCSIFASEDPLETLEVKSSPVAASDDSEEPIPPTPPVFPGAKGKKKVWKTVLQTFQDEDGFFVTKQEKKLVSESESDEETKPSSKSTSSKEVGKPNLFTYRKQASLTSFFKQS